MIEQTFVVAKELSEIRRSLTEESRKIERIKNDFGMGRLDEVEKLVDQARRILFEIA